MATIGSLERQRTRAIAGEYRSKGYEVIEEPTQEQLPDFLSGYHPDLLVRKGDEARVVAIKSRASLAQEPQIRDLARLLQTKPNWNFELVLLGEKEQMSLPEGAYAFDREDILSGMQASERLLELGFSEAALLLAWSSLEATMRLLAVAEDIVLDRLNPVYILNQAVMHGVISRDEYNFLTKAMQYRNALVHGFKTVDFDLALVKELISTTQRLLQQAPLDELEAWEMKPVLQLTDKLQKPEEKPLSQTPMSGQPGDLRLWTLTHLEGPASPSCLTPLTDAIMTTKLYWHDSQLTQFSAQVMDCFVQDGHQVVVLDQSAFYPGGGGQPYDTGAINAARVMAVSTAEDGRMLHHLEGDVPFKVGEAVAGAVDWPRRLEMLQQHTGQHILSQAFFQLFGAETRGFRIFEQVAEIDLTLDGSPDELAAAIEAGGRAGQCGGLRRSCGASAYRDTRRGSAIAAPQGNF